MGRGVWAAWVGVGFGSQWAALWPCGVAWCVIARSGALYKVRGFGLALPCGGLWWLWPVVACRCSIGALGGLWLALPYPTLTKVAGMVCLGDWCLILKMLNFLKKILANFAIHVLV